MGGIIAGIAGAVAVPAAAALSYAWPHLRRDRAAPPEPPQPPPAELAGEPGPGEVAGLPGQSAS